MKSVKLSVPLKINVKKLAKHLPNLHYRGRFELSGQINSSEFLMNKQGGNQIVLGFKDEVEEGFTKIVSHLNSKALSAVLLDLPEELRDQIVEALKDTELELHELSAEEIGDFTQQVQKDRRLQEVNALEQKNRKANFSAEDARDISQHCIGYTDANSDKPILGTCGIGPCVGVAIYNPEIKVAALTHLDTSIALSSVEEMFAELSKDSDAILQVHLRGGDFMSRKMIDRLLELINGMNNVEIISADLISEDVRSIAIDARTGEIYTEVLFRQLDANGEGYDSIYIQNSLNLQYDGRGRSQDLAKPINNSQQNYDTHRMLNKLGSDQYSHGLYSYTSSSMGTQFNIDESAFGFIDEFLQDAVKGVNNGKQSEGRGNW